MTSHPVTPLTFTDCTPAWQAPYFDQSVTPQLMAAVLATAAGLLFSRGYHKHGNFCGDDGPISLAESMREAAKLTRPGNWAELEEECSARLGGFLYLTGRCYHRSTDGDMAEVPGYWDRNHAGEPTPPGDCLAVQLLNAAAAFMMAMAPRG
jgi:hypothetical protein